MVLVVDSDQYGLIESEHINVPFSFCQSFAVNSSAYRNKWQLWHASGWTEDNNIEATLNKASIHSSWVPYANRRLMTVKTTASFLGWPRQDHGQHKHSGNTEDAVETTVKSRMVQMEEADPQDFSSHSMHNSYGLA